MVCRSRAILLKEISNKARTPSCTRASASGWRKGHRRGRRRGIARGLLYRDRSEGSMKFRVYKALARGVVLESVRRKDLWVVAILGFLILIASGALGFFGVEGLQSFAKDLAAS